MKNSIKKLLLTFNSLFFIFMLSLSSGPSCGSAEVDEQKEVKQQIQLGPDKTTETGDYVWIIKDKSDATIGWLCMVSENQDRMYNLELALEDCHYYTPIHWGHTDKERRYVSFEEVNLQIGQTFVNTGEETLTVKSSWMYEDLSDWSDNGIRTRPPQILKDKNPYPETSYRGCIVGSIVRINNGEDIFSLDCYKAPNTYENYVVKVSTAELIELLKEAEH